MACAQGCGAGAGSRYTADMFRRSAVSDGSSVVALTGARGTRILRWLIGPRFIDLPIRALALMNALTGLLPGAAESDEPLYLLFHYGSRLSFLVAAFFPFWAGPMSVALFLVFMALFPDFLNPFQEPLSFAAAVLLSRLRWITSLIWTAGVFGLSWIAYQWTPEVAMPYHLLVYSWLMGSLLALTGALLERRIHREIELRTQAGREHERQLERERVGFAVNAHDTVSHGLATQAAMIRLLSAEKDQQSVRHLLSELSMANDDTQQQLRSFLAELRDDHGELMRAAAEPEGELEQAAESLRRAAESGGIRLSLDLDLPPAALPPELLDDTRFVLRELVTNMVKHSTAPENCEVSARLETGDEPILVFRSRNPSRRGRESTPRSLSLRAEARGGVCEARHEGEYYVIEARLPIPA